jgi:hypothetical protein
MGVAVVVVVVVVAAAAAAEPLDATDVVCAMGVTWVSGQS